MNLLLVIYSLDAGGAERVMSQLASYWSQQGHKVTLLNFKESSLFYPLHSGVNRFFLEKSCMPEPQTIRERIQSRLKTLWKLGKVMRHPELFGADHWDKVISFMDVTNISVLAMSWGLTVPVIVCERTNPHFYALPKVYDLLRRWTYPWAEKILCQTQSAASYFPKDLQKKIVIIPNAVVTPSHQAPFRERMEHIVSVGRLDEGKDHLTLIRAFHELSQQDSRLRLTIYGEGPFRGSLESCVAELGLQEAVFMPGKISDVTTALCDADLFVFPSRYEGFPNALCEAMAVGLPVIASDCSGNIDVVRDGEDGYLFPVGDVARLTELMRRLLEDPAERKRLAEGAKSVCQRFQSDTIFRQWDKVCLGLQDDEV